MSKFIEYYCLSLTLSIELAASLDDTFSLGFGNETAIYAGFGTELVVELSFSALGCPNVKFEAIRGFVGI